jgi:Xaa-Pro aminopeptidase
MKIKELQDCLKKKGIDFAFFYNFDADSVEPSIVYFSGYSGYGILIVPASKKPFMIVPKMELGRVKKKGFDVYVWDKKKLTEQLKQALRKKGVKIRTAGIDETRCSVAMAKKLKMKLNLKFKGVSKDVARIRAIKTKEEIANIRKACQITDQIFSGIIKNFKTFRTESDIAAYIDYFAKKEGCDLAFKPIVASGGNSPTPHYEPGKAKLNKGFCVLDFGVKYNHYCSDMTRTIYIGKPSKKEVEIYNFLLGVQQKAINAVDVNKKCSDIHNLVNKSLGKFSKNFLHGLGHGIGVEIHELPFLDSKSKDIIKPGMVFTIEPGIYFAKRFGIRIEDDILVSNGNVEVLTKSAKKLIIKC